MASIDYLTRWTELVDARADQGRRLDRDHGRADAWAGPRAQRFRALAGRSAPTDPLLAHLWPRLQPTDVVLDAGAGPGRHVIPIAEIVQKVIAVEPSAGMRGQLAEALSEKQVRNVEIIPAEWPSDAVDSVDVALCSHVVYGVSDIEAFIRRLDAVAKRHCAMVLRHGQREAAVFDLFETIWSEKRCLAPTYVDLLGALEQVGILANVTVVPFGVRRLFESFESAVEQVRADLLNPASPEATAAIRADLERRLVVVDGRLAFPDEPAYAGILWWERS